MKNITIALLMTSAFLSAQTVDQANTENANRAAAGLAPVFRVTVTERTAKAISYQHRSGATKIDFRGTALMPGAHGEAKVESKKGYIEIEVEFRNMQEATQFGGEYLTYVLWAITPEGRPSNLGEILRDGTSGKVDVTTELQSFGLIVTAEPYFAVSRPSDVVIMENAVRPDTAGTIELIDAKYELLQRGQYERLANVLDLKLDRKTPLELYEARNALHIARSSGADRFAADTFQKAESNLKQAEEYRARNAGSKPVTLSARLAVQVAEDARAIAVKRQEDAALTNERQAAADRESRSQREQAAAKAETERVSQAAAAALVSAQNEADRIKRNTEAQTAAAQAEALRAKQDSDAKLAAAATEAERVSQAAAAALVSAQNEADRIKRNTDAQTEVAQAEALRAKQDSDAKLAAAATEAERVSQAAAAALVSSQNEADRIKRNADAQTEAAQAEALRAKQDSDAKLAAAATEAERVKRESDARNAASQAEADRLRQENADQRAAALNELDRGAQERKMAESEKTQLRTQLLVQFNAILQTRDTARGLIVNMSDVLFDTGKSALRPEAREKLAKVAGIVSGHAGLQLDVEGHTDNVGADAYNQTLSEQRGGAVRDYLVGQGVAGASVSSKGFGKTQPVAGNETAIGRQQNRRVEMVISGELIGGSAGLPLDAK